VLLRFSAVNLVLAGEQHTCRDPIQALAPVSKIRIGSLIYAVTYISEDEDLRNIVC
jgi:hypothetical protein